MRYLLSLSFCLVCAFSHSQSLDLDFVPYEDLDESGKESVGKACSGKFVDRFGQYTNGAPENYITKSQNANMVNQDWLLEGEAQVIQKSFALLSDSMQVDRNTDEALLSGDAYLRFDGIMLLGETVEMDLNNQTGTVKNANFVIHSSSVNGYADEIRRDENGIFYLKNYSLSRCNPDQKHWWLKGTNLVINPNTGMITSTHTFIWVMGVPVFYTPYIHMPYDDHATSGLLVPDFALTNGKISEFRQPIYFRFRPNVDMTTTVSYLSQYFIPGDVVQADIESLSDYEKTGWIIDNEIRFLGNRQQGELLGAYSNMPSQTKLDTLNVADRFYFKFKQKWDFDWFTSDITLNALSDPYFFQDFYQGDLTNSAFQSINNVYKVEDSVVNQTLEANWVLEKSEDKFHFFKHELSAKEVGWNIFYKQHWQTLDSRKSVSDAREYGFQLSPAFEANHKQSFSQSYKLNHDLTLQIANFDRQLPTSLSDQVEIDEQLRLALKSNVSYPMSYEPENKRFKFTSTPNLLVQGAMYPGVDLEDNELERGYINYLSTFKNVLTIPVELNDSQKIIMAPEFIWQYAPLVDSSYLPALDSSTSTASYGNSIRFTGLDRLGDTNTWHYGLNLTYQNNNQTRASFSIKQSKTLEQERFIDLLSIKDPWSEEEEADVEQYGDYDVQASLKPNNYTQISSSWRISPDLDLETNEFSIKYNLPSNQYVRFTSNQLYSQSLLDDLDDNGDEQFETQLTSHSISLSGQWALNYQIGLIGYGKWQYSFDEDSQSESRDYELEEMAIGVEYDDCCWAVRMLSYNNFLNENDLNNKLHFQVIFKGMGQLDQGFEAIVNEYLPAYPGSLFE